MKAIKKYNNLVSKAACTAAVVLCSIHSVAQQRFPVTATTIVNAPHSTYLSDYTTPGSQLLVTNFVFNDFSEPSWTVRLNIRIESTALKLETRPEFRPAAPITVVPGAAVRLSGSDLEEYLNYTNLNISGSGIAELQKNGRLQEGLYTFCIEVLDYNSGKLLSNISCATVWLNLNDPAKVISPLCGTIVDPTVPLNIPFQWQLSNSMSPNAMGARYKLIVYEVTDPAADPFTAINNGKVLPIFESNELQSPTFLYDNAAPPLDVGKTYVYQIAVNDLSGKEIYKNNGLSEVCWFHYGYPERGTVQLITPQNDYAFSKSDQPYFKWSAPNNRIDGQSFRYRLDFRKIEAGQSPEDAVYNQIWHSQTTPKVTSSRGMDVVINKSLEPGQQFIWQVTAQTGNQTVAQSAVRTFSGPPLIDWFYAGIHKVNVISASSTDSLSFSGHGSVQISETDSLQVPLTNLHLKRIGAYWVLENGEIITPFKKSIILTPEVEENGEAEFNVKTIKLNKNELAVEGSVRWKLPHPTTDLEKAYVMSKTSWLNYDKYKLLGTALLDELNEFELLEPFGYTLELDKESEFLISNDKFKIKAIGSVSLPEKIKRSFKSGFSLPFSETNQLFYFESEPFELVNSLKPIEDMDMYIDPTKVVFDFSEEKSTAIYAGDASWKGIYFNNFKVRYGTFIDDHLQLKLDDEIEKSYNTKDSTKVYVDASGLNLMLKHNLTDSVSFNEFRSVLTHLEIDIEKNEVVGGEIEGMMQIPFFKDEDAFDFTATINSEGIQPGYLNVIENTTHNFNNGDENQLVIINVKKAVFEDQQLLNLSVDMEWPAHELAFSGLNDLKIWGDKRVGFGNSNGLQSLPQQHEGSFQGYPVVADKIGVGRNGNYYSIAVSTKAHLADDISGAKDSPVVNVYSVMENNALDTSNSTSSGASSTTADNEDYTNEDGSVNEEKARKHFGKVKDKFLKVIEKSKAEIMDFVNNLKSELVNSNPDPINIEEVSADIASKPLAPSTDFSDSEDQDWKAFTTEQRQEIAKVIDELVIEMLQPTTQDVINKGAAINQKVAGGIDNAKNRVTGLISDKVSTLVNAIASKLIKIAEKHNINASREIRELAHVVAASIYGEINTAIDRAVSQNITSPISNFIMEDVSIQVSNFINVEASALVSSLYRGKLKNPEEGVKNMLGRSENMMTGIAGKFTRLIAPKNLQKMVQDTGDQIFAELSTEDMFNRMKEGAKSLAKQKLNDKLNQELNKRFNNVLGEDSNINFAALWKFIKNPNAENLFTNPVKISINNDMLSLQGSLTFKKNDFEYGNMWRGNLNLLFKKPDQFGINATFINGRKDGYGYWFCQASPGGGDDEGENESENESRGEDENKYKSDNYYQRPNNEIKALKKPINLGPAQIWALNAKAYRRMREQPDGRLLPDPSVNWGAGFGFILFDREGEGQILRAEAWGRAVFDTDKDFTLEYASNLQSLSPSPEVLTIDPRAPMNAEVAFTYNSAEKHFIGYGRGDIEKEGAFCAGGPLFLNIKPGKWEVTLGRRRDRINFLPGCGNSYGLTGWLDLKNNEVTGAAGLDFRFRFDSDEINLELLKARVFLDMGVAAGTTINFQYKPKFKVLEAGLWQDVWADGYIWYKFKLKKAKTVRIAQSYAQGDYKLRFSPKPSLLYGKIKGKATLFGVRYMKFDKYVEFEL